MRLERSVFSIRPLSFAFQVDKRSALPGEILDSGCNFHQKWVCNCPKDSYNLADRASIAIQDWRTPKPAPLKPEAPHKQPFIAGVKVDPPAMARSGGLDGAGKGASNWNYGGHEAPRTMATACRHPKVRIVSRHEDTEFVECLECGEIFDSEEFRDMEIEDTAGTEDLQDDS